MQRGCHSHTQNIHARGIVGIRLDLNARTFLPELRKCRQKVIYVAALARAGMAPDWLPGVVPRCVPVATYAVPMPQPGSIEQGRDRDGISCDGVRV